MRQFWAEILRMASTLVNHFLDPDLALTLLNHCAFNFTRALLKLLLQVMTASKQTIARAWKTPTLCTLETKNRVTQAMIISKIEATI